jgi:hypothetical protein
MKQVKLIAALLLFALGASAQTVTPDPGPYTPMNQKYEYRWIKTSGGLWNIGKFVQVDSAQFSGVTYVPSAASNDSTIKAANTGWVRRLFATASGSAGKWDTAGNAGLTDPRLGTINNSPFAIVTNNIKRLIIPAAGILPATTNAVFLVRDTLNGELKYSTSGGGDTTGLGNLYIRNTTTQENKRFNVKGGRLDTLYASTSAGGKVVSNGGTIAAEWGAGGGSNFDFHGFAGYNANRASSYTTRSFTDKNYVDSSLTLKTTVTSYGKNAGGDSTILLLSNGTRFAARDSIGGGGGSGWGLTGNSSAVTDFLGTTNNRTMRFRTNNVERMVIDSVGNVGIGIGVTSNFILNVNGSAKFTNDLRVGGSNPLVASMTVGSGNNSPVVFTGNTAMGLESGLNYDANDGRRNSSFGFYSAKRVSSGYWNTLLGATSGEYITSGFENTGVGYGVIGASSTSNTSRNVAVGSSALSDNTGNDNVAVGRRAARYRVTGNTDIGYQAGDNANGSYNVSLGYNAGQYTTDYKFYVASIPATNGNLLYGDFETGQLKINNTNSPTLTASAQLEVVSTTRGFLLPRMTTTERNAISTPATALQVFSTTDSTNYIYRGTTSGWQATITGIRGSATLDFGNTAAQTSEELTITVTGAADGDVVSVSPLNAAYNANTNYTARVSAANTVSVAFNNFSAAAVDPASAVFKVVVFK